MFGFTEAEVAELVRAVAGAELDRSGIEERFARAAWSGISEPGDRVAGELVAMLGAPTALTAVIDRWAPEAFLDRITSSNLSADDIDKALERWTPRLQPGPTIIALRQAARFGARLRVPGDESWPIPVDDLGSCAPLALWTRGADEALESLGRSISLVGARAASGYGEHVTMEASAGLVDRGYAIVSGAAYGIDGMAHRAALASHGMTIAFLAGGVDRFYPSGHDALLGRIVDHGMVISELPCGSQPTRWRFLQRNRLIAASSLATVVLEAGWRSGSLNTAGHAAALGRPLGAVPGPVTSPTSAGCHRLIREFDAVCVTTPAEMAELVGDRTVQVPLDVSGVEGVSPGKAACGRTSDQVRVFDALSARSPRSIPELARRSGLSSGAVRGALGALDLEGAVREREAGWVRNA